MSYDPRDDEPEDHSELREAMEPWPEDLDPDYDPTPQGEEMVTDPYDAPSYKGLWDKKMMDGNPHYEQSLKETASEWALVEAYRAMAFEMRTANMIAALQPVRISGGKEYVVKEETVVTMKDKISKRMNL